VKIPDLLWRVRDLLACEPPHEPEPAPDPPLPPAAATVTAPVTCTACGTEVAVGPGQIRAMLDAGCVLITARSRVLTFCCWAHAARWMQHPSSQPQDQPAAPVPLTRPDGRPALRVVE
jgi:hypothetical protein